MLPELERPRLDAAARARLARALSGGPWCWPADPEAMARAVRVVPAGPPLLAPGQALVVAAGPTAVSLAAIEPQPPTEGDAIEFGTQARVAWGTAAAILPRALPILWSSVRAARHVVPRARLLASRPRPGAVAVPDRLLDGPSFGLSFLLAVASLVLDDPLPSDVAASAALGPTGRLEAAGGIAEKVEAVVALAPRVRRLLVAPANEAEARGASAGVLDVLPVATAAQALQAVFGERLAEHLAEAGRGAARRAELVDSFFRLVLMGRGEVLEWGAVRRGAEIALDRWADIDPEERRKLEFSWAVAARHESNQGPLPVPDEAWLARLAAPLRVGVAAHYVQQSTDTGGPPAAEAEALALRHLVTGREAFPPHLKLQGALARLLAVTGREPEALRLQEDASRGFLERLSYGDVSFPLAECYRLSGVLGDRAAFERAEETRQEAEDRGGPGFDSSPFVDLGRARALVLLGDARGHDPEATLRRLAGNAGLPAHVRWSAARWAVRWLESQGRPDEAAPLAEALATAVVAGGSDAATAERFFSFVGLDRAVRARDTAAALGHMEAIRRLQPGLASHLLSWAPLAQTAAFLADHYPY